MNKGVNYSLFYDILLNLRSNYHSYGRIDDSNAKLDEMIKIISVSYSLALKGKRFSLEYVRQIAFERLGDYDKIAEALRIICEEELQQELFYNYDGTNIFGTNPTIAIQTIENDFAQRLVSELEKIDFVYLIERQRYSDFDIVNECFGHFVRDNFRNNKEDAQYMTPYELSGSVLEIVFDDMKNKDYFTSKNLSNFTVMDPSCGVGTLLIESSSYFADYVYKNVSDDIMKENIINNFKKNGIIGQDKIDRMIRFSKINALLLGSNASNINQGNSIVGRSSIDNYVNGVDLIFTNPPFGAEYENEKLNIEDFPILKNSKTSLKSLPSEILLLDKCINLLKNGGYLAIVLPDSVFAAKGIYSIYRDYIIKNYSILGVVGLPSVTFAQAGTRTNTCILILKKTPPRKMDLTFMADCKSVGYVVKERAGVPVKIKQGTNEMPIIAEKIINMKPDKKIICEEPSITMIKKSDYIGNNLKPSFYAAARYKTINSLQDNVKDGFTIKRLSDVVEFVTIGRKSHSVSDNVKHISVLHVNSNCTISLSEVDKFVPVSKGRECNTGEMLFSKINPRIPRIAVVPDRVVTFVCSNEFEILKSKGIIGMYALSFILKTESVMNQIKNLTSGTSSSHSRIKREQLADILIPIPCRNDTINMISKIDESIKSSLHQIYISEENLFDKFCSINEL